MDKQKRIICCGSISFDLISGGKDEKSGMCFNARPGGSVFNTAMLLARLGLSVSMAAKNGKDFLGESLLQTMSKEKIDTKFVMQDRNIKTGLAIAKIDKKGNSSYLFYRTQGPQTSFKTKQVPLSLFKKADIFHTGSAYSYNDFTFEDTLKFLKQAKKENTFTSYDPNWRASRIRDKKKARNRIKKLLPYVDLLKLSDTGAMAITGTKTLSGAIKRLPENTVVTLGDNGAFYRDGRKKIFHPACKVRVVDTIGAGDAFMAGLIYRYCVTGKSVSREEKKEDLAFASALAALICTGTGATEALRNLKQVQKFLKSHRKI